MESVVTILRKQGSISSDSICIVSVCIEGKSSKKGIVALKTADFPLWKEITFGAFGILYLEKNQKISLCAETPFSSWRVLEDSIFSIARILPWKSAPGLLQQRGVLVQSGAVLTEWSTNGQGSAYKRGSITEPITFAPSNKAYFNIIQNGVYLVFVSVSLYINVTSNQVICVGSQECSSCELEFVSPARKGNETIGLVGFLKLSADSAIYTCLTSNQSTAPKIVVGARRSVQLVAPADGNNTFSVLMHNSTSFNTSEWHKVTDWFTRQGKHGISPIQKAGLYIVAINIVLSAQFGHNVSVKLETSNSNLGQILHATSTLSETSNISFSATGLLRAMKGDVFSVLAHSDSSPWMLPDVHPQPATFSFVQITEDAGELFGIKTVTPHSARCGVRVVDRHRRLGTS